SGRRRPGGLRRRSPARLVGDLSRGVYHRRAAGPRRGRPRPHHPAGAWAPARWPPPADGVPRAPRGAGHAQGGDPMSPRRSVGRDAPGTATRRQVRRARAPHGTGSRVEYLLVPRVFGLGGPLVAMVGTTMGAGQRDRAMRAAWIGAAMATGLTA